MKRILLYIFTVVIFALGACKKTASSNLVQMTASVDNTPWTSYSTKVSLDRPSANRIIITADSSNTHMRLEIGNYAGVGTYVISDSGNVASYTSYEKATGNTLHKATSGQIVITANTTNGKTQNGIKGTFQFLADNVQVTQGTFDVNLYLN